MTDNHTGVRRFDRPRRVLVDPRRIWPPLPQQPPRTNPPTIGENAASLDPRLGEEWIDAVQYSWARFRFGRNNLIWLAEIAVDLATVNRVTMVTLRQWVPADAVRLPPIR
ncbi:hypothetical protein [Nocardia sp. NPDC050710]|uniref:hypothetical protein n=1 Tax=Nocardia sp. NPDC050710 TaxID=3157220 RepID=UPI0033E5A94A